MNEKSPPQIFSIRELQSAALMHCKHIRHKFGDSGVKCHNCGSCRAVRGSSGLELHGGAWVHVPDSVLITTYPHSQRIQCTRVHGQENFC